jgi:hypothetical protein
MVVEPTHQGPMRPPQVREIHRRDEAGARPTYEVSVDQRHRFNDLGARP